ncbi:restriction endonuclease subunit S [Nocardia salmonicida]|uniref:restriction endonuclease subunit S n=1 Tax=Nocardia salmonicida TaxID=53431 RepID=UPI00342AEE2E
MSNTVALGEIAEINPRLRNRPQLGDFVSFLGMADVDAEYGTTSKGSSKEFGEVAKGYTQFENGDILVAKITPCFENGKIAQAVLNEEKGAGSTEFHVVRPDPAQLDNRYLLHFLRQPYIRIAGERRMTGSGGQRRVPETYISHLEVRLPELGEQRRIAEVLDRVDELRAKRRQSIALLDDLAQSIFLDMFGDPTRNSMGWPESTLGELGILDRGVSKHRPRNDPALLGGQYPLIQTGDVAQSGGYIENYSSTYSELGLKQSRMWPKGTLCITIAANIAKSGLLEFEACFPDSVVGFTADPGTVEYVRGWLSIVRESIERLAPESAQKNINLRILRGLPIPHPPAGEIATYANRIASIRLLALSHREGLAELDTLFASTQARAFKGDLWKDDPNNQEGE